MLYRERSLGLIVALWSFAALLIAQPQRTWADTSPERDSSLEQLPSEGRTAFQRGDFEHAVLYWREIVQQSEQNDNPAHLSDALVDLALAYQALGQYHDALESLERARSAAQQAQDPMRTAAALQHIGNIYVTTGPVEKAMPTLMEALDLARQAQQPDLSAAIQNDLGNFFTTQRRYDEALAAYQESTTLAQGTGNLPLAVRAQTNAATASVQQGQYEKARSFLDQAAAALPQVSPSHDTVYGWITLSTLYRTLGQHLPDMRSTGEHRAFEALSTAATRAETLGDRLAASHAWGLLGTLYEDARRYPEALELTERAVFAAQQVHAPESLYRWQWQAGRILKAVERKDEAIAAYRGAVASLQAIRQELSVQYGSIQTSFRTAIGPVYFELVDLLLQRATGLSREQEQAYLGEARETVELLRAAELRDYFHDECVDAARSRVVRLDVVAQSAVVVYPILLPDRTELLVSLPGRLKRVVVPVRADDLAKEVRAFRHTLEKRITKEYLSYAQRLYDWLIRPLEADLTAVSATTLVFVPDGPLRTIPMAALHDGSHFLIEKYALAVTPGLDLTDPRPLQREEMHVFAAGLTESVQGFAPLPYVSTELQALQELYGSRPLLNQGFQTAVMEKELQEKPFSIVHIASHGQFAGDVDKSFLLTFDDKLTIDRLGQVIGSFRYHQQPLELLTLSACETAAGDDRAALGLAGVAIKAGARSALATLWAVNDEAASVLVTEFYRQLKNAGVSRAAALQQAQQKLLSLSRYRHPAYWSPFLLLNNWL